jgi:hypothetical protein
MLPGLELSIKARQLFDFYETPERNLSMPLGAVLDHALGAR